MMGKILINENGTAGRFDTLWTFYVKNTTGFSRGQDIYYDAQTDCLFIPQCNDHNNVNKIMVVNLSGESETYKGNKLYTPQDIITVDKRKDYSKYEIESLVIAPKRHIVMVANIVPKGTITADDAVERISNLKNFKRGNVLCSDRLLKNIMLKGIMLFALLLYTSDNGCKCGGQ